MLQALEQAVETLQELDECKVEEELFQQALGWAAVASSRAEIERLDKQLNLTAPQAKAMADAEKEQAEGQLKHLETSIAQQVTCIPMPAQNGLIATRHLCLNNGTRST